MAAQSDWLDLKARVDNRLSRYFRTAPFRLRNERPIVSFTFDDFPESAASAGVPILDRFAAACAQCRGHTRLAIMTVAGALRAAGA